MRYELIGILALLALGAAPAAIAGESGGAKVLFVRGNAKQQAGAGGTPLRANATVSEGSTVEVPRGSFVRLLFVNGTQAEVGGGSQVRIERTPAHSPSVLKLIFGYTRVHTRPHPVPPASAKPQYVFHVESPHMAIGVTGTDFLVVANGREARVYGIEGTVHVANSRMDLDKGRLVDLPKGQTIEATARGLDRPRRYRIDALARALSGSQPELADEIKLREPEPRVALLRIRIAGIQAVNAVGNSYSGIASWDPQLRLSDLFAVSAQLGVSYFRGPESVGRFLVLEGGAALELDLGSHLAFEAGAGVQDWWNQQSAPYFGAGGAWRLSGLIERVFVGGSMVLIENPASEIRLGVGFAL